jgi:hypothetical protein
MAFDSEGRALPPDGCIWLPRGIPHVWANTTNSEARLTDVMKELMAKYGMEMLWPPIFASSWMKAR